MKKILGLDAGTNSLGWSIIEFNDEEQPQKILDCGVRIFQEVTEDKTKVPKKTRKEGKQGVIVESFKEKPNESKDLFVFCKKKKYCLLTNQKKMKFTC